MIGKGVEKATKGEARGMREQKHGLKATRERRNGWSRAEVKIGK
jgi:hypothetical protein